MSISVFIAIPVFMPMFRSVVISIHLGLHLKIFLYGIQSARSEDVDTQAAMDVLLSSTGLPACRPSALWQKHGWRVLWC